MTSQSDASPETLQIRKYPNRRYYDSTRSRHLTLEDIRALIRKGANVRIVDSQTGADITSKTLMQMILEFDTTKLELFTVPLLVEIIRVNDQVMKGFFEKFFHQALSSFFTFQQHLEKQLLDGSVLPSLFPPFVACPSRAASVPAHTPDELAPEKASSGHEPALAETVQTLQAQMAALQERLSQPSPKKKGRKTRRR